MGARIACLDLDTFFVSVERLLDPSLEGLPVVVGAAPGQRGVVTSCSYEVRALGVRSGMSVTEARRLAPDAIYLPVRHDTYGPYAARVREVIERATPAVQTASIDEFYLDFSGTERLWARPEDPNPDVTVTRVVRELRQRIQDEIGLPCSIGLGTTRPIAKIASGRAKPAGVFVVPEGAERAFVEGLPVRRWPGIGPRAEERLVSAGVETLGQLLDLPAGPLRARFGGLSDAVRRGTDPRSGALGRDRPAFREHDEEGGADGSLGNERTFHADVGDAPRVEAQVAALAERVCWRARRRRVQAGTVTLKLRTADFHTVTRSRSIPPTHDEAVVRAVAVELLRANWDRRRAVRLVGVTLSHLRVEAPQLGLPFEQGPRPRVGAAIDAVRERFGYEAIRLGAVSRRDRTG